jgi:hypothetical protein
MAGLSRQMKLSLRLGFVGLVLIVLGFKSLQVFLASVNPQVVANDQPVLLFFNVDDPCECMVELTQQAEQQMNQWQIERRNGVDVMRIIMDQRKDLEAQYKVFRAPCLVLIDAQGQIVWRQDYPRIEGGPFKLDELESAISQISAK